MIITFSGIDGSGKTYASEKVTKMLIKEGVNARKISPRYATNNIMKDFCERYFGDRYLYIPKLDSNIYMSGLMIDWLAFLEETLRSHAYQIFISDRYVYDVIAQAKHYNAEPQPLVDLIKFFPVPDLSFYLDIEPTQAYERLAQRDFPKMHHLESLDNLEILKRCYDEVRDMLSWKPQKIRVGDDLETIVQSILKSIKP
jgi:thymidylate kinase